MREHSMIIESQRQIIKAAHKTNEQINLVNKQLNKRIDELERKVLEIKIYQRE